MDVIGNNDPQDVNVADSKISLDANILSLDFAFDKELNGGIGLAAATSTIAKVNCAVMKYGFFYQFENLRIEAGIMQIVEISDFKRDNTGIYFGVGVPIIGYTTKLKEVILKK